MGFIKVGVNEAESDEGFVIKRKNRSELEYIKNNESIIIEVEPGDGLAVYFSTFDDDNKDEIIKDVCSGLDFLGIKYIIA